MQLHKENEKLFDNSGKLTHYWVWVLESKFNENYTSRVNSSQAAQYAENHLRPSEWKAEVAKEWEW